MRKALAHAKTCTVKDKVHIYMYIWTQISVHGRLFVVRHCPTCQRDKPNSWLTPSLPPQQCPACQQVARIMYWHPKACWLAEGVCRIDGCWDGRMRKRADPGSKTQSKAPAPVHVYDGK